MEVMRIYQLLEDRFLEPKKPDSIKASTVKKSGMQGSVTSIAQRQFTTAKGNVVKVQFTPGIENDEKSVSIVFYVNDTLYDKASTENKEVANDFDILASVLYVIITYLQKSKVNHVKFEAYSGEGDTKTVKNLPTDKIVSLMEPVIDKLYQHVVHFEVTPDMIEQEQARLDAFSEKFNRPHKKAVIIQKQEFITDLSNLQEFLSKGSFEERDLSTFDSLYITMQGHSRTISEWDEYKSLLSLMNKLRSVVASYHPSGTTVSRNRRFAIYSKMLNRWLSNTWDIKTHGTTFYLDRK